MIIRVNHARSIGYCKDGIKAFTDHHHLDFREFVLRGLPEEELLATKDALAIRLVEEAHKQERDK